MRDPEFNVRLWLLWPSFIVILLFQYTTGQTLYFTNLPQTLTIREDVVSTFVYGVQLYTDTPPVQYDITGGANCATATFTIGYSDGRIYLHGPLDFETATQCVITMEVTDSSGTPLVITDVLTVNVGDANDPHELDNLPASLDLDSAATSPPVNPLMTVTVLDVDDGGAADTAKTFSIIRSVPINPPVSLDPISGDVTLAIIPAQLTDWTGPEIFSVWITATDGHHAPSPELLTVRIINTREPPIILNLDHTLTIPENKSGDIFQVQGWPMPTPRTEPLQYTIQNVYPMNTDVGMFQINLADGRISHDNLLVPFDYTVQDMFRVEVVVEGQDSGYSSSPGNLTIQLSWINMAPVMGITYYATTIPERLPPGTSLPGVELVSSDRDVVEGDWVDYGLIGTGSHLFVADNITHKVYVAGDVIVQPKGAVAMVITLKVYAHDSHGSWDASGTSTIDIKVTDVNDNAPVYNITKYNGQINAGVAGGTWTGVILEVYDQDYGNNALISFHIDDPIANLYFQVLPTVPFAVVSKQPISYADHPNFTFTVQARDGGVPSLNDTAIVDIQVEEVNQHTPKFLTGFDYVDLRADTPVTTIIYTLHATDNDTATVNNITYSVLILLEYFTVSIHGDVIESKIPPANQKYVVQASATDNTAKISQPFSLRIDTYRPEKTLVDVYLLMAADDFLPTQTDFLTQLDILTGWDVRLESIWIDHDNTVVRVYAVESALPDQKDNLHLDKVFISMDNLLGVLGTNLKGTPSDGLVAPPFAPWQPYKVTPAYPVWIIDTPAGVAVLCLLCILVVAGLITMFILLAKKFHWCCYERSGRVLPSRDRGSTVSSEFDLHYTDKAPYHISGANVPGPFPRPPRMKKHDMSPEPHRPSFVSDNDVLPPVASDRPLPRPAPRVELSGAA